MQDQVGSGIGRRLLFVAFVFQSFFVFAVLTPTAGKAQGGTGVFVNDQQLSPQTVSQLRAAYGEIRRGRYWYDRSSGFYGLMGGPSRGQIHPGLALGGAMRPDVSGGGTWVFINGREIHFNELRYLTAIYGQVPRGRYWMNAQRVGGLVGQGASFNLARDAKRAAWWRQQRRRWFNH